MSERTGANRHGVAWGHLLPCAQTGLAAALLAHNYLAGDSFAYPAFTRPDRQICAAINAPASVLMEAVTRVADACLAQWYPANLAVEAAVFLSLVWLLWYGLAVELAGDGASVLARRSGRRRTTDVAAMAAGLATALAGPIGSRHLGGRYALLVSLPYLVWGVAARIRRLVSYSSSRFPASPATGTLWRAA